MTSEEPCDRFMDRVLEVEFRGGGSALYVRTDPLGRWRRFSAKKASDVERKAFELRQKRRADLRS